MNQKNSLEFSDNYDDVILELLNRKNKGAPKADFVLRRDQDLMDMTLIQSRDGPPSKSYLEDHEADTDVEWASQFKNAPVNTEYLAKKEIQYEMEKKLPMSPLITPIIKLITVSHEPLLIIG